MRHFSEKSVLRLLTDDQKENWSEVCQEVPDNANGKEHFVKKVITGDEM